MVSAGFKHIIHLVCCDSVIAKPPQGCSVHGDVIYNIISLSQV